MNIESALEANTKFVDTRNIDPQVAAMACLTAKLAEQALTRFRRSRFEVTHWKPPGLGNRICASRTGIFDAGSVQAIKIKNNDLPELQIDDALTLKVLE